MNRRLHCDNMPSSTKRIALLAIHCIISVTASAQTTLVFAPSIGRDIRLGTPFADVKRQFPNGGDSGTNPVPLKPDLY